MVRQQSFREKNDFMTDLDKGIRKLKELLIEGKNRKSSL